MAIIPKRLPRDVNARAVAIARLLDPDSPSENIDTRPIDTRPIDTISKHKARAALGGNARAANLTPSRKRAVAKRAAMTRWNKNP